MTDWLWEKRESEEQRERVMSVKRNASFFLSVYEKDRRYALKQKEVSTYPNNMYIHFSVSNNYVSLIPLHPMMYLCCEQMEDQEPGDYQSYKLMTSVSMPVFDRRENAVSSTILSYTYKFSKLYILLNLYLHYCPFYSLI